MIFPNAICGFYGGPDFRFMDGIGWGGEFRNKREDAFNNILAIGQPGEENTPFQYLSVFNSEIGKADLLKIDIEGFELGVIQEMDELMILPNIITGEWHFQNTLDGLKEIFKKSGHDFKYSTPEPGAGPWHYFTAIR